MDSLKELFEDTVKDLYNAEKQFVKAMPKLAEAAQDSTLKSTIEEHRTQSEGHVRRLEKIAELCDFKPSGKVCKAAQGLVEEGEEHLQEGKPGPTLDAAIILCAQKNEHYEICSYGTLIDWATELQLSDVVALLTETFREETAADTLLTDASRRINPRANAGSKDREMAGKASS